MWQWLNSRRGSTAGSGTLADVHRYPVKGLPGEALETVQLAAGEGLPLDRRFALTNAISSTNDGAWMPCRSFFINAVHDGLLRFSTRLEEVTGEVCIADGFGAEVRFHIQDPRSLERASSQLGLLLEPLNPQLPPMIAERKQLPGMASGYWDFTDTAVSIINLASIRAVSDAMGIPLDPRRFRGNLLIDGLEPWAEFAWAGKRIRIGQAELDVLRPALRCPATSVDPQTGSRNTDTPTAMQERFGHAWMGMYATVTRGAKIARGSPVSVIGDSAIPLAQATAHGAPDYKLWPKIAQVAARDTDGTDIVLSLTSPTPYPMPDALPGQRLRFHLEQDLWTAAEIRAHQDEQTSVKIEPSPTDDPATAYLLEKVKRGDRVIVTGPFGRG